MKRNVEKKEGIGAERKTDLSEVVKYLKVARSER